MSLMAQRGKESISMVSESEWKSDSVEQYCKESSAGIFFLG